MKLSSEFNKYFFNTNWMFLDHLIRLISGVFVGAYVARHLGVNSFGLFSYVLAFVLIGENFTRFGAEAIVVRDLRKKPQDLEKIMSSAFIARTTVGCIVFLLINTFISFSSSSLETAGGWIFSFIFLFQGFEVIDYKYQSSVDAKIPSLMRSSNTFIFGLIKVYGVLQGFEITSFFIVFMLEKVCLYLWFATLFKFSWMANFDKNIFFKLIKDCWPLALSGVAIALYMRVDQIMLKHMLGARDLGIYSVAVKLTEVWFFIPLIITKSVFPKFVDGEITKRNYLILPLIPCLTICLLIFAQGGAILDVFYGSAFYQANILLRLQIFSLIMVSIGTSYSKILVSHNLQKFTLITTLLGALTNVILNLVLIPKVGILGASYSTLISFSISAYFGFFLFPKTRHIVLSFTDVRKKTRSTYAT